MSDDRTTVGVYEGPEEDLFDRFDEYFKRKTEGNYSRSKRIKESMEVYLALHEAADHLGINRTFSERDARSWLTSALVDYQDRLDKRLEADS